LKNELQPQDVGIIRRIIGTIWGVFTNQKPDVV